MKSLSAVFSLTIIFFISVRISFAQGPACMYGSASYNGIYTDSKEPQALTTADFNGDGRLDFAFSHGTNSITVMLNVGQGKFTSAGQFTLNTYSIPVLSNNDFNKDGKVDFVVVGSFGGGILLGNGNGSFGSLNTTFSTGGSAFKVASADFNGDTWPDLAF